MDLKFWKKKKKIKLTPWTRFSIDNEDPNWIYASGFADVQIFEHITLNVRGQHYKMVVVQIEDYGSDIVSYEAISVLNYLTEHKVL